MTTERPCVAGSPEKPAIDYGGGRGFGVESTVTDDPMSDYRHKLNTPLLTAEEEVKLAKQIEAGLFAQEEIDNNNQLTDIEKNELEQLVCEGQAANQHFVEANLGLVISIARACFRGRRPENMEF
jgi:DNA-directed RNA polymerase sigma subunit (sigma70/sigma32)